MLGYASRPKSDRGEWRGQREFAKFFAYWLQELNIAHNERYDFWQVDPYIAQLVVDAFEDLRTSDDPKIVAYRVVYEADTGRPTPNLIEVGDGDLLDASSAVQLTGFLLKDVVGDYAQRELESYANA